MIASFIFLAMTLTTIASLLSYWIGRWLLLRRIPAGPPAPSWVMGHFREISGDQSHLRFQQWAQVCGPIFRIRVVYHPVLVVTDPVRLCCWLAQILSCHSPLRGHQSVCSPNNMCVWVPLCFFPDGGHPALRQGRRFP